MVKNFKNKLKNKKGFTLVELIVVIVILIILAAIAIPVVSKYIADANQSKCTANARSAYMALNVVGASAVSKGEGLPDVDSDADAKEAIKSYVKNLPGEFTATTVYSTDGAVSIMTYTEGNWKVEITSGTFPATGAVPK